MGPGAAAPGRICRGRRQRGRWPANATCPMSSLPRRRSRAGSEATMRRAATVRISRRRP